MDMVLNLQVMAKYNQRVNDQLMSVCQHLDPAQLNQPTGAFFPSIMAHWNHILFGDLIMLQRLRSAGFIDYDTTVLDSLPTARKVNDTFVESMAALVPLRKRIDDIYCRFTQRLQADDCDKYVEYTTTEGQNCRRSLGAFCQHLFNHQTHHRGQMTCLISQMGLDYGCMDLPVIIPEL